jgi:hypothetical protein
MGAPCRTMAASILSISAISNPNPTINLPFRRIGDGRDEI